MSSTVERRSHCEKVSPNETKLPISVGDRQIPAHAAVTHAEIHLCAAPAYIVPALV